ncbi:sensor histidine kinase [Dorea longicatena]|uniref:sensor histidine kinase n=1 Tax=Dorea longicatena TaxID=88431 RepID=UPI0032C025E5
MEELKYIVEDRILAELLGVQNFSNKESAILELVKNAFDAGALIMTLKISKNAIEIEDNGCGISREDLTKNWMHIGKSDKGYEIEDKNGEKRIQAGSKGVGRFALARLGENVIVESRKKGYKSIKWTTDWNTSSLEENDEKKNIGTCMKIQNLRDKWTEKVAKNLGEYLGRTYCDSVMKINLFYNDNPITIIRAFDNPQQGINYSSKIILNYDANKMELHCDIENDEFLNDAQKYCTKDIHSHTQIINLYNEYENKEVDSDENIAEIMQKLGDFSAEFYFGIDRVLAGDEEKFLYKRRNLDDRYKLGIILYRNSFSISSYEGKKDWLGLGKRVRKSPAAASHPTGSWRVRENQISGKVDIDKKINYMLQDLSNRQGLDENIYYMVFLDIIHTGLEEFERYRQSIIRDINKKNKSIPKKQETITTKIVKNPAILKTLTKHEEDQFVHEINKMQEEAKEAQRNIENTENRYKYDVRILNVLATSGLRATSIAHEMRNDRNKIDGNYDYIVKALKKYEVWDILNEPDHTKFAYQNVPELLNKNKETSKKILQFMDIMLEDAEKEQFVSEEHDIAELLEKVRLNWCRDYAWIEIVISEKTKNLFRLPEDIITVIFDNLILNSIQQNEKKRERLRIDINISILDEQLYINYKDDGVGLPDRFKLNPMKILEPHETSRKKGHGLGMWIVNNTLDMSGGNVVSISSNEGFEIEFTIGGKL